MQRLAMKRCKTERGEHAYERIISHNYTHSDTFSKKESGVCTAHTKVRYPTVEEITVFIISLLLQCFVVLAVDHMFGSQ